MRRSIEWTIRGLCALFLTSLPSSPAQAIILTVGSDVGCQHPNVQSAINALPPGGSHEIRIRNGTYGNQTLTVASRVLTLVGGYTDCAQTTSTGNSTLDGSGGSANSVLTITGTGNAIILQNVSLIRGDEVATGHGGGIEFTGSGSLTLRNVALSQNSAGYGGGIAVYGFGGPAELRIEADTTISFNIAQVSGGGIRLDGDAHLTMVQDRIAIFENEAVTGYGGGIFVHAPATAKIGSPGTVAAGVINNNRAVYGGGLALYAPDDSNLNVSVDLFTTDPTRPVRIHDNVASNTGGGIYLYNDWEFIDGTQASVYAWDFRIDGNSAQNGSAIYADMESNNAGWVYLNRDNGRPPGAVSCAPGVRCNIIEENIAETVGHVPTTGATVLIQDGGNFVANRTTFTANVGGQVIRSFGNADIANSLIADNAVTQHVLRQEEYGSFDASITGSTIVGNTIGATHVISTNADLSFSRSILWQPGKWSLFHQGGTRTVNDLLVNERISLDGGSVATVVIAEPRFVDFERDDYRLRAASPAVDFSTNAEGHDLHGFPRNINQLIVPNRFGIGDVGAYERQSLQPLVLNGDLDVDLNLWPEIQAGASSWTNAQNTVGAPGSGSIFASMSNIPQSRVIVRSQCIHLPGPGSYQLNGWGRSAGTIGNRDFVLLHWELRHNGLEACNAGPADLSGDHGLSASTAWVRPAMPATIEIDEADWTRNSSINIQLAVVDNGATVPPAITGWFDGITLEAESLDDLIFADDFEP